MNQIVVSVHIISVHIIKLLITGNTFFIFFYGSAEISSVFYSCGCCIPSILPSSKYCEHQNVSKFNVWIIFQQNESIYSCLNHFSVETARTHGWCLTHISTKWINLTANVWIIFDQNESITVKMNQNLMFESYFPKWIIFKQNEIGLWIKLPK